MLQTRHLSTFVSIRWEVSESTAHQGSPQVHFVAVLETSKVRAKVHTTRGVAAQNCTRRRSIPISWRGRLVDPIILLDRQALPDMDHEVRS